MKKANSSKKEKQAIFANKGKTKSRNRLLHLMRRFQERHGFDISAYDIENILNQIHTNKADFIERDAKAFVYKVTCRNKDIAVVIDKAHRVLLTTYELQKRHIGMIERNKQIKEQRKVFEIFYPQEPMVKLVFDESENDFITKIVAVVSKIIKFFRK